MSHHLVGAVVVMGSIQKKEENTQTLDEKWAVGKS